MLPVNKSHTTKFVIFMAGIIDDINFIHLCHVTENLAEKLPNFSFQKIIKNPTDWEFWLHEICRKYGWTHEKGPLIWKQIGVTGKKVMCIGNALSFWKYLHQYYKIESLLKKEELQAFKYDLLFAHDMKVSLKSPKKQRKILIIGAGRSVCLDLVPQLTMIDDLKLPDGLNICLYDEPGHYFKLNQIVKDMAAIVAGLNTVQILKNISDGLDGCDILIYLDHLQREEFEEIDDWLKKNYESMEKLADQINQHTTIDMKVIFCSTGPICFCANVLQALTKLAKSSIVAVSAHYGLEIMYAYIVSFGFDPKYFGCPPVWGFLGISTFVDIGHMLQKYNHSELRWFFYMTHDKNPYKYLIQYKDITSYQVGRTEDLQKSKAICDLLKLWYKDKKHMENEIISLGIPSNGAFGIPKGLIYSQPVTLQVSEDNTRIWVPFENFPLPNTPSSTFYNLIFTAECITKKFIQKTPLLYHPNGNMSSCSMLAEEENRNEWEENSFIEFT